MADIGLPTFDLKETDPSAQLRGAALWILGAFVAVGSAQIVAVALDGFKATSSNPEAVSAATFGYFVMFIGLAIGITKTGSLLVPVRYDLEKGLEDDVANYGNRPYFTIFGSFENLNTFLEKYETLRTDFSNENDPQRRAELMEFSLKYKKLLDSWIEYSKLETLRKKYFDAVPVIFLGMLVTFGGIAIFNLAPTLVPNSTLRTQINELNDQKKKLDSEYKTLAETQAEWAQKDKEVKQLKSQWEQATAGQDTAALLDGREKVLNDRETELDTLAAQLTTAVLTSMSFANQPLTGTWTPKEAYPYCATPINVTVIRLWKDKDIMKAQIFASPPDNDKEKDDKKSICAGFVKTVTKKEGTLRVQSQTWTLN